MAGSSPYQGMKLLASHLGGTRNPMVVRWPAAITADPVPRAQFHHCNDVVPTIYEILGISPPRKVNGIPQDPIQGVSFAYCLNDPDAEGRLKTQYFEIMASRGIYHDGWMASTIGPRLPWPKGVPPGIFEWTPDNDVWELYHLDEDWSQSSDLAAQMPEKLAQMKDLFWIEAARNDVLPVGAGLWTIAFHPELRIQVPQTEWEFAAPIEDAPEFCAPAPPGVPTGSRADGPESPGTRYGPGDALGRCVARWSASPPLALWRRTCPPGPRPPPAGSRPTTRAPAIPRRAPAARRGPGA